jgi:hypothetical protein
VSEDRVVGDGFLFGFDVEMLPVLVVGCRLYVFGHGDSAVRGERGVEHKFIRVSPAGCKDYDVGGDGFAIG